MTRNLSRCDAGKRDQIRAVFQTCKEAGFSDEDALFYAMRLIRDGTLSEWTWARYFKEIGPDNPPSTDFKRLYRLWERWFNSNDRSPDEMIIGIKQTVKTKKGKIAQIWYRGLAIGEAALNAAKFCDLPIGGWKKKQTRLYEYAKDPKLKASHDAKFRDLQNKIRRSKKRKSGSSS